LIWRVGFICWAALQNQREFGKAAFKIQPIKRLVIELIKVHFDRLITTEIAAALQGGAMICQSS
jgi:hypothetical protein